jgi:hypothetical protein
LYYINENVTLNCNNYTIDCNNSNIALVYEDYGKVENLTFKNLATTLVYYAYYGAEFNNVDVESGSLTIGNNDSVYVIYATPSKFTTTTNGTSYPTYDQFAKLTFTGCDVGEDVTLQGGGDGIGYTSVFVGYLCPNSTTKDSEENITAAYTTYNDISFTECTFSGTFTAGRASMFIANYNCQNLNLTVTNCSNLGTIRATATQNGVVLPDNEFIGIQLDNGKNIKLTLDDIEYTDVATIKTLTVTKNGGKFDYGPIDSALAIVENQDKTFTITPAAAEGVAKYVVRITIYTTLKAGGTKVQTVSETINVVAGNTSYKTTIQDLEFVDSSWLTANENATKTNVTYFNGYYKVIGGDSTMYYLINEEDTCTLNGQTRKASTISVTAYDAEGKILASATLSK